MNNASLLVGSCLAMVVLTGLVGLRLLVARVNEMREKRIHPQAASTSVQMAAKLQNVRKRRLSTLLTIGAVQMSTT